MLSHDQNFKNLIADYALQALHFILPAQTRDWPEDVRVSLIRQEQLKDRLGDSFRELDIPLRVEFPDGSREALIIVIENESRDRAEFLQYLAIVCIHISMQLKTRRIVPIAFYPFRTKPLAESFSLGDDESDYLEFSCRSCVLGTMNARDFEASRNIVARLCLPLMAHDPADKIMMVTRAYEGLAALEPDIGKRIKYAEFVGMYAALDKEEELEFREKYVEHSPFREDIMSLTEIWKEQGEAKGIEKGIEKGKELGKATGKAEGSVATILELFSEGFLSADVARARLTALQQQGTAPRELVESALAQISK